jgi:2-succinyl-5-enolpyruvyl-6-hydroxy-3-cyclohexene-1-carboxylate synthase
MKIIEAMKRVKQNLEKIGDLQTKIGNTCSNLSVETPVYPDTKAKINEWSQGCDDLTQENIRLLTAIQRTNLATQVTIELGMKTVTKNIAEWVWRRRTYATVDHATWAKMTDRNLKEGQINQSTGQPLMVTIQRHYDPEKRDAMLAMYRSEPHMIDAALEVVNATTELIEA